MKNKQTVKVQFGGLLVPIIVVWFLFFRDENSGSSTPYWLQATLYIALSAILFASAIYFLAISYRKTKKKEIPKA